MTDPTTCMGCGKRPGEIEEYVDLAKLEKMTPAAYVQEEEGTFNPESGKFACTDCYIRMGMPTAPGGWRAR